MTQVNFKTKIISSNKNNVLHMAEQLTYGRHVILYYLKQVDLLVILVAYMHFIENISAAEPRIHQ